MTEFLGSIPEQQIWYYELSFECLSFVSRNNFRDMFRTDFFTQCCPIVIYNWRWKWGTLTLNGDTFLFHYPSLFPFLPFIPVVRLSPYFVLVTCFSFVRLSIEHVCHLCEYTETIIFRGKNVMTLHRYMACHNFTLKHIGTGLVLSPQWLRQPEQPRI